MYRVFLVDDEPLICKGLRETVEWDSLGLEIAGEAHNGVEAMELIAATHTLEEIRKYLDADSLRYLSLEGMLSSVNSHRAHYCTSCARSPCWQRWLFS